MSHPCLFDAFLYIPPSKALLSARKQARDELEGGSEYLSTATLGYNMLVLVIMFHVERFIG